VAAATFRWRTATPRESATIPEDNAAHIIPELDENVAAATWRQPFPTRFRCLRSGTPHALRPAVPSHLHEGLLDLVRAQPRILLRLLSPWLGPQMRRRGQLRLEPADLSPTRPVEYRADLVLTLRTARPRLAIVLEAQLRRRASKRRVWPAYAVTVGARYRCPVALVVLCARATIKEVIVPLG
jgi:hypothetical protein